MALALGTRRSTVAAVTSAVAAMALAAAVAGRSCRVAPPGPEVRIATAEAPVKRDRRVRQATGQHSLQPLPRFEDVQRPVLPIPLGRRDAVVGDCGGVTETIERDQHPASEVPARRARTSSEVPTRAAASNRRSAREKRNNW